MDVVQLGGLGSTAFASGLARSPSLQSRMAGSYRGTAHKWVGFSKRPGLWNQKRVASTKGRSRPQRIPVGATARFGRLAFATRWTRFFGGNLKGPKPSLRSASVQFANLGPQLGALSHTFLFWGDNSPTKPDVLQKVGSLILSSLLEDLGFFFLVHVGSAWIGIQLSLQSSGRRWECGVRGPAGSEILSWQGRLLSAPFESW